MLKKIPFPICGLMLAIAGLGNLLQSYSESVRLVLGAIATIIFIVITIKIISDFSGFREEMKNPITASVIPTYSMSLMLLAGYYKPFIGKAATIIWYIAVVIQVLFMINLIFKFLLKFKLEQVFPTWFIGYVGIVIATVTAKAFNVTVGKVSFWFGLIVYIILLPVVFTRVKKLGLPEPAKPLLVIFAAPGSLLLTGYMNLFEPKNIYLVTALLIVSQLIYLIILFNLIKLLKLKFYPSFAGFTFPMVISATALKLTNGYLTKIGNGIGFLKYIVLIETVIAIVIVVYVFIKYLVFLFGKEKSHA